MFNQPLLLIPSHMPLTHRPISANRISMYRICAAICMPSAFPKCACAFNLYVPKFRISEGIWTLKWLRTSEKLGNQWPMDNGQWPMDDGQWTIYIYIWSRSAIYWSDTNFNFVINVDKKKWYSLQGGKCKNANSSKFSTFHIAAIFWDHTFHFFKRLPKDNRLGILPRYPFWLIFCQV